MNFLDLTTEEQKFFRCLQNITEDSIWAPGIKLVVDNPTPEDYRQLIQELKSQAKDSEDVMRKILGSGCFDVLVQM